MTPTTLDQVLSIAEQMQSSGVDSLTLVDELVDRVRALPPSRGELLSRPLFERASRFTLGASFEFAQDGIESPSQNVELKEDMIIRGVQGQIVLQHPDMGSAIAFGLFAKTYGLNLRTLGEIAFRVDSQQGFQSEGRTEVLERMVRVAGDGSFSAPLDWELEIEQTIEGKSVV